MKDEDFALLSLQQHLSIDLRGDAANEREGGIGKVLADKALSDCHCLLSLETSLHLEVF